ncbi:MAG: hypothetical protein AB1400_08905 [Pseudomonadota bacterium]
MVNFNNQADGTTELTFRADDKQYRVRFDSGTSTFSGQTGEEEGIAPRMFAAGAPGIQQDLADAQYQLIAPDALVTLQDIQHETLLAGMTPTLHLELSTDDLSEDQNYVVLIFDNEKSALVDWVIPKPPEQVSRQFAFTTDRPALHFEIPLLPTDREPVQDASPANLHFRAVQPESQLTFGIFRFNQEPELADMLKVHRFSYLLNGEPLLYPEHLQLLSGPIQWLAKKADAHLKDRTDGEEQFQRIARDGSISPCTPDELANAQGGKALLLCHGILSATYDAFHALWENQPANFQTLCDRYQGNVFAWDHYTLSKYTADNAEQLLDTLQHLHNVDLDIVCHSRGAGVVRNLVENPQNRALLNAKNIRVRKVIFVAGACLGSQLATPQNTNRLFRRLNMLFYFFGGAPGGFLKAILLIIKLLAAIAHRFPGVESMDPLGEQIKQLNKNTDTAAQHYLYIRANYGPKFLPLKLADEYALDQGVFNGAANDLVVPYDGASASTRYLPNFTGKRNLLSYDRLGNPQDKVWHIKFFLQPDVCTELLNELT